MRRLKGAMIKVNTITNDMDKLKMTFLASYKEFLVSYKDHEIFRSIRCRTNEKSNFYK